MMSFSTLPLQNPGYTSGSGQGVRLTLSSRFSIFALSYWYLFSLRMTMELIIYYRPRQAILNFANRYSNRLLIINQAACFSSENIFQLNIVSFCSPYSIAFLRYNLAFSLCLYLLYTYLIPLRCYDAIMLNKRFLRSYVEIQMAQKLVANEKVVKMRELLKQSLRYFIRMF